jgi:hypothetical protein
MYFRPEFMYLFINRVLCLTFVFIQCFYGFLLFILVLSQIIYCYCLGIS